MRINTGSDAQIPNGVIVHGKVPLSKKESCSNCAKQYNCVMLNHSVSTTQAIGLSAFQDNAFLPMNEMPLPMPCGGIAWQSLTKPVAMNDPLVQRLCLSGVGEPIIEVKSISKPEETNDR